MRRNYGRAVAGLVALAGAVDCAFAGGISLAPQVAAPGSSVLFPVMLTAPDDPIGTLQFDLEYDNSVMSIAATLGDSSHNSLKSLFYTDVTPQKRRFLLVGLNGNPIPSGVLLNLFVNMQSAAPNGAYALKFSNVAGGDPAGVAAAVAFTDAALTVQGTGDQSVSLASAGVLNSGSQLSGPVAPGELITLIGSGIGPEGTANAGGLSVLFDGVPAPVLYAGADEIHAVVSYAVAGKQSTNMQITHNGQAFASLTLPVAAASPALFTTGNQGVGQGAILNQDSTLNSPSNPASAGSAVALYATGAGQTTPAGVDGVVAGNVLAAPNLPVTVQIGGLDAQVLYAGAAPGLISGATQINVLVPQGLAPGPAIPVTFVAGTVRSPIGATLAIH